MTANTSYRLEIATLSSRKPKQLSFDFTPRRRRCSDEHATWVIYAHTCRVNGKKYIGQTMRGARHRWLEHVSASNNNGGCKLFNRAIRKYGHSAFDHEALESGIKTLAEANAAEIKWIAHYRTTESDFGYNLNAGGYVCNTHPDTKRRLSASILRWHEPRRLNLTGRRFGRLTVSGQRRNRDDGTGREWLCKCSCKAETERWIRQANLVKKFKPTRSCGCLQREARHMRLDDGSRISVAEMVARTGLCDSAVHWRLSKGETPQQLLDRGGKNAKRTHTLDDGRVVTTAQLAAMTSLTDEGVLKRIRRGWTAQRVIDNPGPQPRNWKRSA